MNKIQPIQNVTGYQNKDTANKKSKEKKKEKKSFADILKDETSKLDMRV